MHGAWQKLRQVQQEVAQRKAISIAAGVQCNGLPTFHAYKGLSKHPHLFFDTRTEASMLATRDQISHRSFQLSQGHKLRLTFSGRLTLMKGVNDLLTVADNLRRSAVGDWFELSICGDGDYVGQLRQDIDRMGLGAVVKMRGNMDFKTELVPFLKTETDLFVCCHRQGDPSCTYLETMACGVPIIGYANEAWDQLSEHARIGWTIKTGDAKSMADKIAQLYSAPDEIEKEAVRSLNFASRHTFESTFQARVEHMRSLAA
jgi:glycosyltransferase involved in cell wall biosynthesis